MTPDEWARVKEVLDYALGLPPGERAAHIAAAAGHDPIVASEVHSLLRSVQTVDASFLSVPAVQSIQGASEHHGILVGRRFGPYEVVEQVGAGGMGEVYRALRADDEYRKQVAIKVVRSGPVPGLMAARFRNERQILAGLEHPNIARMLDGGSTQDGWLFFVMELIDGQPLTDFCDANRLSVTARLELFLQVCAAVQYAHQRLIIHRDIKPSNVLVTKDRTPKLLDFGIAKILDSGAAPGREAETVTLFRALTPEYASPEQFKGETVSTTSDVYSLGIVLYELLTGRHPYKRKVRSSEELEQLICDTEPGKPSTAVSKTESDDHAAQQESFTASVSLPEGSPEKLTKRLRGDLDNIILKAIRKDPQRRYPSVEQFAQDIRRHLNDLPVSARPDTLSYRARKFVVRHKTGVGVASLFIIGLIAGLAIALWQAHVARLERARAEQRFNDVRALANSLLFEIHDAIRELPGSTPARRLIADRALRYLDSLSAERENTPSLMRELAAAYEKLGEVQGHYLTDNLGNTREGLQSYQKALQIRKRLTDSRSATWQDQLDLAKSYRLVSSQMLATGDAQGAFEQIQNAIAATEAINGKRPKDQKVLYELSYDHEIAGDIQEGGMGQPVGLGNAAGALDSYQKAVAADEICLQLDPSSEEAQHSLALDQQDVGDMLLYLGDRTGALQRFQQALAMAQKIRQHTTATRRVRDVAVAYNRIVGVYQSQGQWNEALQNSKKALEIYQQLLPTDPQNALLQQGLAIAQVNTGDLMSHVGNSSGIHWIDLGIEGMSKLSTSSPDNAEVRGILATMYATRGESLARIHEYNAARKEYERAVQLYVEVGRADQNSADPKLAVASCEVQIGRLAAQAGNFAEASRFYDDAMEIVQPLSSPTSPNLEALYTEASLNFARGDLQLLRASTAAQDRSSQRDFLRGARLAYQQSLEAWHKIQHPGRVSPQGFPAIDPDAVASCLRHCEAVLAAMND